MEVPMLIASTSSSRGGKALCVWRLLFLLLISTLIHVTSRAQQVPEHNKLSLNGRVIDANGAVVAGAAVTLRQRVGSIERTGSTDAGGAFRFAGLTQGHYQITAGSAGFSDATIEVMLPAGNASEIALTLRPGSITEKVTITATRAEVSTMETSVPVTVVGNEEIQRRSLATIGDVFRYLPGTSTVSEGPFQVRPRIRGLDSNRVLVLVDGERLNNARTSTANSGIEIGLVDVDQIERVEVARGSGSVLYGTDALAGTINIITQDTPARLNSGVRFGGGINGLFSTNETGRRGSAYLTGTSNRFAFRVAQTLDRFGNYHSGAVPTPSGDNDSSEAATEVLNSQYHGSNTQLVGRFFISDSQSVRVAYDRRRAANIGVAGVVGVFTAFFPFSNRDKVSARYEGHDLLPGLVRLSLSTYYQKQDRNFSNMLNVPAAPPFFPGTFQFSETNTRTATAGFDAQSNWALSLHNVLTAGVSYSRDHNRDSRFIESFSPNFRTNPPSLTRSEDRSRSVPDATFADLAVFAQDEHQVGRKLSLVGGVRLDSFRIDSERTPGFDLPTFFTPDQLADLNLTGLHQGLSVRDTAVSGDFGAVYRPIESIALTARVGRSFREPNLFERFFTDFGSAAGFVVGNPNLKPESGVNVDAAIKVRTDSFAGSFTYFNNTYTNFLTSQVAIDRSGVPITISQGAGRTPIPVFRTANIGRTRIRGIEGELETSVALRSVLLTSFGSVSTLRGDDLESNVPLDFITPLKTVAGLRAQDKRDRFWSEWTTRIVNTQRRLSPAFLVSNGGAEPGFVTHDLRSGYNFRREGYTFGLSVAVTNLANRFYSEQFVFAPARGRSATIGVHLRFF